MGLSSRIAALAVCSAVALGACGGAAPDPPAARSHRGTHVTVDTFRFSPRTLRVTVGTRVRWENRDEILHTVTAGRGRDPGVPGVSSPSPARPSGAFDGRLDGSGSSFAFTFTVPGSFPYFCAVHSGMAGTVLVS